MKSNRNRLLYYQLSEYINKLVFIFAYLSAYIVFAQPPQSSEECLSAMQQCESSTDCIHRLAALQASCVTNTCQPQCRESAMSLFQNREGRQLLRTDTNCVPGRYELEKCGFLPNKLPKHCNFAKLICESDLQCNAKWEVFMSECEAETNEGRCSKKCRKHLNETILTKYGNALSTCTCTDKDDSRCSQLRNVALKTCLSFPIDGATTKRSTLSDEIVNDENFEDNNKTTKTASDSGSLTATNIIFIVLTLILFFAFAHNCHLYA